MIITVHFNSQLFPESMFEKDCKMYVTLCSRFCPNGGIVVGCDN